MTMKAALYALTLATALFAVQPVTTGQAETLDLRDVGVGRSVLGTVDPETLLPDPVSCKGAKRLVKEAGYKKVKTIECNGPIYTFKAKKGGEKMVVTVNKYNKLVSEI